MERFWQVVAGGLLTVILGIALSKQNKDMATVLTIAACCMVLAVVAAYFSPVIDFLEQLESAGQLDSDMLRILLKAVGIGLIAEIAGLICSDSGNAALGKAIQILATAVVLWLSIPLMQGLMETVQKILGEL